MTELLYTLIETFFILELKSSQSNGNYSLFGQFDTAFESIRECPFATSSSQNLCLDHIFTSICNINPQLL